MDLSAALSHLVASIVGPFWKLLFGFAGLLALIYVLQFASRVMRANQHPGHAPPVSMGEGIFVLLLGAALVNMPAAFSRVSNTLSLGAVSYGAIDYPGAANFGKLAPAVNAVLTIAAMAGGAYALRGLIYFKKATSGGQSGEDLGWKGCTHLFGGIALIQLVQLVEMLRNSTGGLW